MNCPVLLSDRSLVSHVLEPISKVNGVFNSGINHTVWSRRLLKSRFWKNMPLYIYISLVFVIFVIVKSKSDLCAVITCDSAWAQSCCAVDPLNTDQIRNICQMCKAKFCYLLTLDIRDHTQLGFQWCASCSVYVILHPSVCPLFIKLSLLCPQEIHTLLLYQLGYRVLGHGWHDISALCGYISYLKKQCALERLSEINKISDLNCEHFAPVLSSVLLNVLQRASVSYWLQ